MTPEDEKDAVLVARAVKGDPTAFSALAGRHGLRLARTVRAMGVAPADVEDVVQTTLISAWRSLVEFDTNRSFLAWISVIAANKSRDWARHRRVRKDWLDASSLDGEEAIAVFDPVTTPQAQEFRDRLRAVEAAIRLLPENLRTPLVMMAVSGLTQKEVGSALGISEKTTEKRIRRARELLTAQIA